MLTPKDEIARAIVRWEGLFQAQPQDAGNYVNGRLVGTMRGVTPAVLAAHRGVPAVTITEADMRSVTLEEAAEIGETRFYKGTGLDMLPWGPTTAALVDVGWGSGPRQAVLFAQRLSGAVADGVVGPDTVAKYSNWVRDVGWEEATRAVNRMRRDFCALIISRNPQWEIYRQGWNNRADWMLPGGEWWAAWAAALPPPPQYGTLAGAPKPAPVTTELKPPPATPTEAAKQAAAGKTGKALIVAAATGSMTAADALTKVNEATTLATAGKGFLGIYGLPENIVSIVLGIITVLAIGLAFWRYGYKLLRGEAVST